MTFQIVQIVPIDATGDTIHRVVWPSEALTEREKDFAIINIDPSHKKRHELAREADLLILMQPSDISLLEIVFERKSKNIHTIVEYNDNFYEPQPWSPVAQAWSSYKTWQNYELFLMHASAVMVTGVGLQTLFKNKLGIDSYIIENHLKDVPEFETILKKKKSKSFGWAGSLGHIADLLSVVPVIKKVLKEVPDSIFYCMGNETIPEHLNLPKESFVFQPWSGLTEYLSFLEQIQVGIIPLLDTPYNQCRSDIKAVEMMSRGVIPVVPKAQCYQDLIKQAELCVYETHANLTQKIIDIFSGKLESTSKSYEYIAHNRVHRTRNERALFYRKFLPKTSQSQINFTPGIHQINLEKEEINRDLVLLATLQDLVKEKKAEEAISFAEAQKNALKFYPEYYLLLQKIVDEKKREDLINQAIKIFPKDIRFYLLKLPQTLDKIIILSDIFTLLSSESPEYRKSVSQECDSVLSLLKTPTSEELNFLVKINDLLISPHLSLTVSYELFKKGESVKALELFEKLQRDILAYESLKNSPLSSGYVSAFTEAIKGQMK